ncbi:MAG: substrate-binding domain-containing protein [Syntrophomonadaceae bacterium]|nr:substrate-binding domain-containing protein [Syntrophomonadaceae bacterium]
MKKIFHLFFMAIFLTTGLLGCNTGSDQGSAAEQTIKLATTTSTEDSGLLDVLLPEFKKDTGYDVEVIAVGTGAAIGLGEKGDVDVILVHSRTAEDQFVADGFGVNRKDVMYNDFLIIGPEDDPAGIKGENDAVAALTAISETESTFLSRGDDSGTHKKEKQLWETAGITPEGEWYVSVGKGMGDTFRMANEMNGYTLIDRGTFLFNRDKYELEAMVEGDELLFNPYGVIAVNKEKHPNVNFEGATAFIEWLTSKKAQDMIAEYGKDEFGQALFVPNVE